MNRVAPHVDLSALGWVLNQLPPGIRRLLGEVDCIAGVDAIWMGVNTFHHTEDGRFYRDTSYVIPQCLQLHLPASMRATTMVLLSGDEGSIDVIRHELGHMLDDRMNYMRPDFEPLDSYAATNHWEAFATAFQSWATEAGPDETFFHNRQRVLMDCPAAAAFFESFH